MTQRLVLYSLLAVVAAAAAVLSFAALRDLALLCGFSSELAWLLPVAIDAGAAAGSLVWLGRRAPEAARSYARTLALTLLGISVAANALSHGLSAGRVVPVWWVVVLVSAVAPSILGAVIHLGVLVGRPLPTAEPTSPTDGYVWNGAEVVPLAEWRNGLRPGVPGSPASPSEGSPAEAAETAPDRFRLDDEGIAADAREWAVDLGRPPSRDEMLARYRIGASRCRRVRETLGWTDTPTSTPTAEPTGREGPA